MSNDSLGFFKKNSGGMGAPSFYFKNVGDKVSGRIISIREMDQTKDDGSPQLDKNGDVKKMLQVVLQTKLRNWAGVRKIPKDAEGNERPASQDDGARAVYVRGMMIGAVTDAIRASGTDVLQLELGGDLAVKHIAERDTGKMQPQKLYKANYRPPSPGADFLGEEAQEEDKKAAEAQAEAAASDDDDMDFDDDEMPFD